MAISYSTNYQKNKKERKSIYTVIMDQQFLRMTVDHPQKKLKKYFCNFFRDHDIELTTQCNRKVVKTHHTVVTESTKMK